MKSIFSKIVLLTFMSGFALLTACSDGDTIKPGTPKADRIAPDSAAGGSVLTLTGSGLGQMRSIVFENGNVPTGLNPSFNTENAIVFRVPDTANGGLQKITFTNVDGKSVSIPFKVIALPSVSSVTSNDFTGGDEITLTGNNLADVSSVRLSGTTTAATVLSKSKKQLVIKMPVTSDGRTSLDIVNSSGLLKTTQEFVNVDKAFQIFTDGYGDGFADGSWGDAGVISSTIYKYGKKSIGKTYASGNWHVFGFANWNTGVTYSADYKFLTFWVKGASADYSLYISSDQGIDGFGSFNESNKINVPANVWTYYKIPVSTLKLWANGNKFNQLGFRIKGPDTQNETFYIDNLLLVK
ncbi:IPT/TIG domain-containing protein [Pseudarcicella hirudinis]|uniref:IPT/TIG domain-containing protein n=2 Tax=Pseudarcicella hirudinis TaxID=1079859 RepID=A0A1I5TJF9_9BACT|nr:IPT/TIG domain-containing protein [Pseudarcicella hirudinis]SFP83204.1 IPT/TIG domain-containing protein [Pseudarcicella hirudinis]